MLGGQLGDRAVVEEVGQGIPGCQGNVLEELEGEEAVAGTLVRLKVIPECEG